MGKLKTQAIRVLLDDDTEQEVCVLNVDMVAFDRERGKHRDWPSFEDAPIFWANYLAWHAMTRTGQIPAWTFTEFQGHALVVHMVSDDEEPAEEVDPTPSGAGPE